MPRAPDTRPVQSCSLSLALTCLQPPHMETKAPAQPACSLPVAQRVRVDVQLLLQPHRAWAQPTCGLVSTENHSSSPRAASELRGLCPHWCADSRCTPTPPAVTACFLPTLQSPPYTPDTLQSSPPANSSANWWPDHSFPNGV